MTVSAAGAADMAKPVVAQKKIRAVVVRARRIGERRGFRVGLSVVVVGDDGVLAVAVVELYRLPLALPAINIRPPTITLPGILPVVIPRNSVSPTMPAATPVSVLEQKPRPLP